MAEHRDQHDIDPQLEDRLSSYRDRIAYPQMGDSASRARQRIESSEPTPVAAPVPAAVSFDDWDDEPADNFDTSQVVDLCDDHPPRRLRQVLGLAAAAVAILIIGGTLIAILPGITDDDSPAVLGPDTTGYEFVGTIGEPRIPGEPVSIAVDSQGTIYAADIATRSIHKFDPAGEFVESWTADDAEVGPFARPWDLAIGPDDSLYVLDQGNASAYHFDSNGTVLTSWFAGTPDDDPTVVSGIDVSEHGLIYVTDANAESILIFDQQGSLVTDLPVADDSSSGNDRPVDVAVGDDGTIYVTSFAGETLRIYNESGQQEAEIGGESGSLLRITVGPGGTLYANSDDTITRLTQQGADAGTFPVDGSIGQAISLPGSIAVGTDGHMYIPDVANHRILVLDADGEMIQEIRDERPERLGRPGGLEIADDGLIWIYEADTPRILSFDPDGTYRESRTWRHKGVVARGTNVRGDVLSEGDNLYVVDGATKSLVRVTDDDEAIIHFASQSWIQPTTLSRDSSGNMYVFDQSPEVFKYNAQGAYVESWVPVDLGGPGSVVLSMTIQNDRIYLSHMGATSAGMSIFDLDGNLIEHVVELPVSADGSDYVLMALAVAPEGDIFAVNPFLRTVRWYSPEGEVRAEWPFGVGPEHGNQIPYIAVSDTGTVYISDAETRQILVYEPVSE